MKYFLWVSWLIKVASASTALSEAMSILVCWLLINSNHIINYNGSGIFDAVDFGIIVAGTQEVDFGIVAGGSPEGAEEKE